MADIPDIEFKLKTTGDTTGAEEVEQSIFAAEDAAKTASRQADVDIAKGKQAEAVQRAQAESLREIADGQQRIVAANLAGAIGKIAGEFSGMSAELDMAIQGTQNFLNVFASTGNPIAATLALVGTSVNALMDAYRNASAQAKLLAKEEEAHLKKIAELRAAYARQISTENLTGFFQRELEMLDEQEAVLLRISRIRASERELEAARRASEAAAAVAGGGTTAEGAAAVNLAGQVTDQIVTIQDSLKAAATAQQKLQDEANILGLEAKALTENTDEQIAAVAAASAKQKEADKALEELDAQRTISSNQIQTLLAGFKTSAAEIGQAGTQAMTEAVKAERDALAAEVARLGGNASSQAKAALALLEKALEDSVVKPDEYARIIDAQGRVSRTQEGLNTAVLEGFNATEKALAAMQNLVLPMTQRIEAMAQQISLIPR